MATEEKFKLEESEYRFAETDVLKGLGHLKHLAGTWMGHGMNLIARPAFHYKAINGGFQPDLFLQINFTREHLKFTPIGSNVPNRGFRPPQAAQAAQSGVPAFPALPGQDDVILQGLTYLQQISDAASPGIGAMHIEPGIWMLESPVAGEQEVNPDNTPPPECQAVTRMASIPHGSTLLAQGIAKPFSGKPVFPMGSVPYNGSMFPAFNSTPFAIAPTLIVTTTTFNAATTSMAELFTANGGGLFPNFKQYTLLNNPLTNLDPGTRPDGLTQEQINDPIVVLQKAVQDRIDEGYEFEGGIAINICTEAKIDFEPGPNLDLRPPPPALPPVPVSVTIPQFNGGAQNTVFLADRPTAAVPSAAPQQKGNAQTQIVYATFWIENLRHIQSGHEMVQLQYAQMVTLNFPAINITIPNPPPPAPAAIPPLPPLIPAGQFNMAWPHISVGTLCKVFA